MLLSGWGVGLNALAYQHARKQALKRGAGELQGKCKSLTNNKDL